MSEDVVNVPQKIIPIHCPDESQTFFNTEFNESYHSHIGPVTESFFKFVNPCEDILKHSSNKKIKILDLFFGLGYNSGIAINHSYTLSQSPNLEIVGIENDISILKEIKNIKVPDNYRFTRKILQDCSEKSEINFGNVRLNILIGDVFSFLNKLEQNTYDIIFFDPFSYKTAPEFWEENFLLQVFKMLTPGGKLTTYSGLKRVEKLALDNGFKVIRVPAIGRKKHSLCIINPE